LIVLCFDVHSQGAQVAHLAAGRLSSSVQSRVRGAIVFGDPKKGQAFAGGIAAKTFCNLTDNICAGGAIILPSHLTYGAVSLSSSIEKIA
jgi:cutinase